MKISKSFIFASLMWLACCCSAEVKMKDENGKYRHHDPEVRQELLSIAEALRSYKMYPKVEKLYKTLTRKWSKAGYEKELSLACQGLFATLFMSDRLGHYQDVMKYCPVDKTQEQIVNLADDFNIDDAIRLYRFLSDQWLAAASQDNLKKVCQRLKAKLSQVKALSKYADSPNDCSGLKQRSLQIDLARHYMISHNRFERQQAMQMYQRYIAQWQAPEQQDDLFRVCQLLQWLLVEEGLEKDIDQYINTCPAQKYTMTAWDPSTSPLMEGYIIDFPPEPINRVAPKYPQRAIDRGIGGYAQVGFVVTTSGDVRDPYIIESFDSKGRATKVFNRTALAALKKMKFNLRKVDGTPVEFTATYKFIYEVDKSRSRW